MLTGRHLWLFLPTSLLSLTGGGEYIGPSHLTRVYLGDQLCPLLRSKAKGTDRPKCWAPSPHWSVETGREVSLDRDIFED